MAPWAPSVTTHVPTVHTTVGRSRATPAATIARPPTAAIPHPEMAVKVPARATVFAYEVSPEGIKTPLGKWEVPPDQLRRTWRSGPRPTRIGRCP